MLVLDNLNTHNPGSLDETFAPEEAHRLTKRFEWHYTPEHASWLNIAECELSVLVAQCLKRRIPDKETLACEAQAWEQRRNRHRSKYAGSLRPLTHASNFAVYTQTKRTRFHLTWH